MMQWLFPLPATSSALVGPSTAGIRQRRPSRVVCVLLGWGLAAAMLPVAAVTAQEAPAARVENLTTVDAALREAFPKSARFEQVSLVPTEAECRAMEKRLRRGVATSGVGFMRALDSDGAVLGYARVIGEIGKFHPITFLVATTPKAKVQSVSVLVYRESHGGEVRRKRFLRQFRGKGTRSSLRLNRDVINISGATLSARAIARGVKRVVHSVDQFIVGPSARKSLSWLSYTPPGAQADGGSQERNAESPKQASSAAATSRVRRVRYAMGTTLDVQVHASPDVAARALAAAFDEVERLEALLSSYRTDSDISRVNRTGAAGAVVVSSETIACLSRALEFARLSAGAFDPTLQRDGHRHVVLDRAACTVRLLRPSLRLDLGGIGKGFALDQAARVLEEHGVSSALLNFGGQVLALDPPPGAAEWIVAVRDPADASGCLGFYSLQRGSVATSGSYERGAHVTDPRTGGPPRALASTCVAHTATAADAWSTIADVVGAEATALASADDDGVSLLVVSRTGELLLAEASGQATFQAFAVADADVRSVTP